MAEFLRAGTKVRQMDDVSVGVVAKRTAHTHRAYTVVFFPFQDNPHLAHHAKSALSKGIKLRVLTARLEITP